MSKKHWMGPPILGLESPHPNKIMVITDEAGVEHPIYGDEFAAYALNDALEKLKTLEAENAKQNGNVQ